MHQLHSAHANNTSNANTYALSEGAYFSDGAGNAWGQSRLDNSYILAPTPVGTEKAFDEGNYGGVASYLHRWNPFESGKDSHGRLIAEVPIVTAKHMTVNRDHEQ